MPSASKDAFDVAERGADGTGSKRVGVRGGGETSRARNGLFESESMPKLQGLACVHSTRGPLSR